MMGIDFAAPMAGMMETVFSSGMFWLSFIFIPIVSLTPDLILKAFMMRPFLYVKYDHKIKDSQKPLLTQNGFVKFNNIRNHTLI